LNIDINQLIGNSLLDSLDINRFQDENHGTFTLKDIVAELKPGLDPAQKQQYLNLPMCILLMTFMKALSFRESYQPHQIRCIC
jgi:transcriptional accessory protein Tex/SPT6